MGLDVTWYRRLKLAPRAHRVWVRVANIYCEEHVVFFAHSAFPGREEGVRCDVCYEVAEGDSGDAFSATYVAYSTFRAGLAAHGMNAAPDDVWGSPDKFRGLPFFELVNFADNEGTIGPVVAAKLAHDFESFRAHDVFPNDAWMRETYWRMHEAFEMAADGGAVKFH